MTHDTTQGLVDRLREGVREVGLHDDNSTELFDVLSANELMHEAADFIDHLAQLRQSGEDYERWFYSAKDTETGMPYVTHLLYKCCDNDPDRFSEAERILQIAFEAGRAALPPASSERERSAQGGVPLGCTGTMTPERIIYFLDRFKREERMLGPHEQWALNMAIAILSTPPTSQREARLEDLDLADGLDALAKRCPQSDWQATLETVAQAIRDAQTSGGEG